MLKEEEKGGRIPLSKKKTTAGGAPALRKALRTPKRFWVWREGKFPLSPPMGTKVALRWGGPRRDPPRLSPRAVPYLVGNRGGVSARTWLVLQFHCGQGKK